jgi:hypothetical protein
MGIEAVGKPAPNDRAKTTEGKRRLPSYSPVDADQSDDPERQRQAAEKYNLTETIRDFDTSYGEQDTGKL